MLQAKSIIENWTEPEVFSGQEKAGFHQARLLGLGTYISLYGKDQPLNH